MGRERLQDPLGRNRKHGLMGRSDVVNDAQRFDRREAMTESPRVRLGIGCLGPAAGKRERAGRHPALAVALE